VGRGKPRTGDPVRRPVTSALRSLRSVLVTWRAGRFSETGFVQVGRHPGRITCKPEVSRFGPCRRIGKLPYYRPHARKQSLDECLSSRWKQIHIGPNQCAYVSAWMIGPPGQYFYNAALDREGSLRCCIGATHSPDPRASVRISSLPNRPSGFVACALSQDLNSQSEIPHHARSVEQR